VIANFLVTILACQPVFAWGHAGGYRAGVSGNDFGGRSAHLNGVGSTHTNAAGGNTTHIDGEGTTHSSAFGTSSTHYQGADGGYSTHTNQYGDTTTGKAGYGAVTTTPGGSAAYYHAPVGAYPAGSYAYHPPTVVNSYSSGCYSCGGWSAGAAAVAGAAAGMATGAAIASANSSAAAANAYAAGVATGAAGSTYAIGQIVAAVPTGCTTPVVQGQTYYLCGNTWFSPAYGANGVYYRVVTTP
jgi:hypothetical protein